MASEIIRNTLLLELEIELERDDEEGEDRRHVATCPKLTGCRVYATSGISAIEKMRQAVEIWLDLANRQIGDDPVGMFEAIEMRLS